MVNGICSLCKQEKELLQSHYIPNFVGKKLKKTSATGFLRGIIDPSKRMQDLKKSPLLCSDCEQILSGYESYFASHIFHPFIDVNQQTFEYDENLSKFIISLSWRTLRGSYVEQTEAFPNIIPDLDEAEEYWRNYLLGNRNDFGPYENHMLFLDYVEKEDDIPEGFEWYTLRATDGTLVGNDELVFSYTKFPWMFFVTSINPIVFNGWINTKIEKEGTTQQPQYIKDVEFGTFFINRARMALDGLGKNDDANILKSIERNPERFLKSESFMVALEEAKRTREKKKKNLPEAVTALMDIIERGLEPQNLSLVQTRWLYYTQRMVLDSLSYLEHEPALKMHELLGTTLQKSKETHKDQECSFETSAFMATFIVDFSGVKQGQIEKLQKTMDKMIETRAENDGRILVAFSFNPTFGELPFETLYYID